MEFDFGGDFEYSLGENLNFARGHRKREKYAVCRVKDLYTGNFFEEVSIFQARHETENKNHNACARRDRDVLDSGASHLISRQKEDFERLTDRPVKISAINGVVNFGDKDAPKYGVLKDNKFGLKNGIYCPGLPGSIKRLIPSQLLNVGGFKITFEPMESLQPSRIEDIVTGETTIIENKPPQLPCLEQALEFGENLERKIPDELTENEVCQLVRAAIGATDKNSEEIQNSEDAVAALFSELENEVKTKSAKLDCGSNSDSWCSSIREAERRVEATMTKSKLGNHRRRAHLLTRRGRESKLRRV